MHHSVKQEPGRSCVAAACGTGQRPLTKKSMSALPPERTTQHIVYAPQYSMAARSTKIEHRILTGCIDRETCSQALQKQEKWRLSMPWSQFWLLRCALAADWRCSKGAEEQRWRTNCPQSLVKQPAPSYVCEIHPQRRRSSSKKTMRGTSFQTSSLRVEGTGLLRQLWGFADNYRGAARLATSIALNPPWNLSVFLPPVQRWHWSPGQYGEGSLFVQGVWWLCLARLACNAGAPQSLSRQRHTLPNMLRSTIDSIYADEKEQVSSALFFLSHLEFWGKHVQSTKDADVSNVIIAIPTFTQQNAGIPTSQKHPRLASSQTQLTVSAKATSWAIMDTIKISCSNFSGKLTLYVCVGLYIQFLLIVCCIFHWMSLAWICDYELWRFDSCHL